MTCLLLHVLMSLSSTSNTSHCLAEKKVEGPTGGPSLGGTMMRRLPPARMPRMPSSKPGMRPYSEGSGGELRAACLCAHVVV
jgi:hypothetical protein